MYSHSRYSQGIGSRMHVDTKPVCSRPQRAGIVQYMYTTLKGFLVTFQNLYCLFMFCCAGSSLVCSGFSLVGVSGGYSLVAVHGLLSSVVASLVVSMDSVVAAQRSGCKPGLLECGLGGCGAWA